MAGIAHFQNDLLLFLEREYSVYHATMNGFFKEYFHEENKQVYRHVVEAINFLIQEGLIVSLNKNYGNLGANVMENGVTGTFTFDMYKQIPSAEILLKITYPGLQYLAAIRRENEQAIIQERQTKSIEQSNDQNILVGKSVVSTNEKTLMNFKTQRNFTIATIFVAICAVFVAAIPLFNEKDAQPDIQPIVKKLETQRTLLQNMIQVQKGIDSSLRIMAGRDSLGR